MSRRGLTTPWQTRNSHHHDYIHLSGNDQARHTVSFLERIAWMSLRKAYAATLQWLRVRRGLSQAELQTQTDQAHISRLEASTTSASVDLSADLAHALGLTPLSFLTLVAAAHDGKTARAALTDTLTELEQLGALDEELPSEPQKLTPPRKLAAEEKLRAIRELREAGLTQMEVSRKLGLPTSTVGRLWHLDG